MKNCNCPSTHSHDITCRLEDVPQHHVWRCECGWWVQSGNLINPPRHDGERIAHDPATIHFEVKRIS